MTQCTYAHKEHGRCPNPGKHQKVDDGAIILCDEHSDTYDSLQRKWINEGDKDAMKKWLGFYVRSQGGAEVAAKRTMGVWKKP